MKKSLLTATAGDVTPRTYYNEGTKWVKLADASSGAANLYNTNGTLTGNRTVTLDNNSLSFTRTAGYVGAVAIDSDALKSRISILIFNN